MQIHLFTYLEKTCQYRILDNYLAVMEHKKKVDVFEK